MRDEQVRRYARHILLPDVGGLGQTALLVAIASLDARAGDPAALVAARYLAAGGVGTVVLCGATAAQLGELAHVNPDTKLIAVERPGDVPAGARVVALPGRPAWWPGAPLDGQAPPWTDEVALALWRGAIAATTWMADIANA